MVVLKVIKGVKASNINVFLFHPSGFIPTRENTLFDYCADRKRKCWIPWNDVVSSYDHDTSVPFDEIIVPNKASCRIVWLMNLVNQVSIYPTV